MSQHTEFMANHIREKTRDVARTMRDYADKIDRLADEKDLTYIPAAVVQTVINMQSNLRYDLPAVWLGELLKAERAEVEHAATENALIPAKEND